MELKLAIDEQLVRIKGMFINWRVCSFPASIAACGVNWRRKKSEDREFSSTGLPQSARHCLGSICLLYRPHYTNSHMAQRFLVTAKE